MQVSELDTPPDPGQDQDQELNLDGVIATIDAAPVLEPEPAAITTASSAAKSTVAGAHHHLHHHHPQYHPTETSPLLVPSISRSRRPFQDDSAINDDGDYDDDDGSSHVATPLFLHGTSRSRFWFIFSQVLMVQFMACFDGTIMASSHPVITSYFDAANSASWLSTAFLLTSTAFQPLLGRLSDALGRKYLFLGALVIFTVATLGCALANSIEEFIVARAFCGLGAGGGTALGSIIISDLVPIERRGSYQSYLNIMFGIGSALGAAVGGAMAEALGWRWEFGIQFPPLLVCLAISAVAVPDDLGLVGETRKTIMQAVREFDTLGSVLLTSTISFLILGLSLGGNVLPWSHPLVIVSLGIFVVLFPAFLYVESLAGKPIMPLHLITHPPRANIIFANFLAAFLANAIYFNIPLYFQAVLLMSATDSGLRLVLPVLISSAIGAFTGFAISWTRRLKWPLVCGAAWYLVGTVCLSSLQRDFAPVVFFLTLLPSSIGGGFQFPGSFMAILASSAQAEQAVVSSTLILWRSLGSVLGVAVSSLILQNALVYWLAFYVSGDRKDSVVEKVRSSVEAVALLEQPYRDQVIEAYEASLRITFASLVLVAAASLALVSPIKMAKLSAKGSRRRDTK